MPGLHALSAVLRETLDAVRACASDRAGATVSRVSDHLGAEYGTVYRRIERLLHHGVVERRPGGLLVPAGEAYDASCSADPGPGTDAGPEAPLPALQALREIRREAADARRARLSGARLDMRLASIVSIADSALSTPST